MSWIDGLRHRLDSLLHPDRFTEELDEEMRFHVDLDAAQQADRERARRRFGNRTYYTEETRRMTWLAAFDTLQQDARYAWRSLSRTPGFALLVIGTFALGIGVNAATFTLLDRMYLRPPAAVARPGELHRIWNESFRMAGGAAWTGAFNLPMFTTIRAEWPDPKALVAVHRVTDYRLGGTRAGAKLDVEFTTGNYFSVLGIRPGIGRFFTPDDDRSNAAANPIVLSDHLWRAQFNADSSVVGKTIQLDEERYVVIGVAQSDFTGINLEPTDAWVPMGAYPTPKWLHGSIWDAKQLYTFQLFGRARPGQDLVGFEQRASRSLRALNLKMWEDNPDTLMNVGVGAIQYARGPGKPDSQNLISTRLSAVALIVLLIAAANITNLLLARAEKRRREIAVRLSLGISRARLVRMLTTETLILALLGAAAAIVAARWGGGILRALLLPDVRWTQSAVDSRIVLFTLGLTIVVGVLAGVVPAWQASKPDLTRALKEGSREGFRRSRLRSALLVVQAALSVTLLAGSALFLKSLRNVEGLSIGYDVPRLVFGRVDFDAGQQPPSPILTAGIQDVARELAGRPGVQSVSLAAIRPMAGFSFTTFWYGNDSSASLRSNVPTVSVVSPSYFATTGMRLLRGRTFGEGVAEVVVNDAMAQMLWPGKNVLGECMRFEGRTGECYPVVGVTETARRDKIIEEPTPQFYLPLAHPPNGLKGWRASAIIVRAAPGGLGAATQQIQNRLREHFPGGYPSVRPMTETLAPQYRPWRLGAVLFTGFGVLALIVAMIGIYSTVSYSVTQRTHEFGVRTALGASVTDVLRQVLSEGLRIVAIGVVVGIGLALVSGRLIAALLYGVQPSDPAVLTRVSLVLLAVAAIAALIPAWRATRVSPVVALRSD